MIAVITGDIINSAQSEGWKKELENALQQFGKSPKDWMIYRGDSFQLKINKPEESLSTCLIIRAFIKKTGESDVRMSVGIGATENPGKKVTENQGEAYVNSGRLFNELSQTLDIRTPHQELNIELSAAWGLVSAISEQWPPATANTICQQLLFPEMNQSQLAEKLNIQQSAVSKALIRGRFKEIMAYEKWFRQKIKNLA